MDHFTATKNVGLVEYLFNKIEQQADLGFQKNVTSRNPGEKPHRIFEDLQGLSKTCQRSLKTRIFKGSLKDLLKIFKDL